jgi:hypothetical protein
MKKIILPLALIALFCFSGATEPSRFATPEEMGRAVLTALKNNDSLRFLQLYPSRTEADVAFIDPWKDSSIYDHQVQWVDRYFRNDKATPREMFRNTRKAVIDAGYNWKDVEFVSVEIKKESDRSPGIDYLYRVQMNLVVNTFSIGVRMSDVMKTKDGWNCGLIMKNPAIETPEIREMQNRMSAEADRLVDSMNKADSMSKVIYKKDEEEQAKKKKPH